MVIEVQQSQILFMTSMYDLWRPSVSVWGLKLFFCFLMFNKSMKLNIYYKLILHLEFLYCSNQSSACSSCWNFCLIIIDVFHLIRLRCTAILDFNHLPVCAIYDAHHNCCTLFYKLHGSESFFGLLYIFVILFALKWNLDIILVKLFKFLC